MGQNPWRVPDSDKPRSTGPRGRLHLSPDGNPGPAPDEIPPSRPLRLVLFLLGLGLLMYGLSLAFPVEGLVDPYLVRAAIIVVIFGGAAAYWSRSSLWRLLKFAGLWGLIIAGLAVFYLYRSDFGDRIMAAIDPSGVVSNDEGMMVHRARDGHFWLRADLNGVPVRLMVDTGASNLVLSPADAKRIGLNPNDLDFNGFADTANGPVSFANVRLGYVTLGSARFQDVPATVNGAEMAGSLLGMAVLNRFSSVEFRGDVLVLRP